MIVRIPSRRASTALAVARGGISYERLGVGALSYCAISGHKIEYLDTCECLYLHYVGTSGHKTSIWTQNSREFGIWTKNNQRILTQNSNLDSTVHLLLSHGIGKHLPETPLAPLQPPLDS